MRVTCNECRQACCGLGLILCGTALAVPILGRATGVLSWSEGLEFAAMLGIPFALLSLALFVVASGRAYSVTGRELRYFSFGRERWSVDLAENPADIRRGKIYVGRRPLYWIPTNGRTFSVLSRLIDRVQGQPD